MIQTWKPIASDQPGTTRYEKTNERVQATITREEGEPVTGSLRSGFFGLGTSVEGVFFEENITDEVVLEKLHDTLHPPRYTGWEQVDDQEAPGVTHYRGRKTEGLPGHVDAYITRSDDEVQVVAQAGPWELGTRHEAVYFAPTPGDAEILRNLAARD